MRKVEGIDIKKGGEWYGY